jgi:PIN domain nuclease of toxin-antitoxin system
MASYATARRPPVRRVAGSALWRASRGAGRLDALLLDTHIWLWTLDGTRGMMTGSSVALVAGAAADGRLFVSDMSFWEVSLKAAKGKLTLPLDATLWLERAAKAPGIQFLPVTRNVLIQSTRLPGDLHGDPVDRILLAQAQLRGLSLLTCDRLLVDYAARQAGVPVCDARGRAE